MVHIFSVASLELQSMREPLMSWIVYPLAVNATVQPLSVKSCTDCRIRCRSASENMCVSVVMGPWVKVVCPIDRSKCPLGNSISMGGEVARIVADLGTSEIL